MKSLEDAILKWTEMIMRQNMHDFKQLLDANGISPSQAKAIMRLHFEGSASVSNLANFLGFSNAAASQSIDKLVQRGWLVRTESPGDRRGKDVTLSPLGKDLVCSHIQQRKEWMEKLTRQLTPEQLDNITSALYTLIEAASQLSPEEIKPQKIKNHECQ